MEELRLEQKEDTLKGILSAIQERCERIGTRGFKEETKNLRETDKLREAYISLIELWNIEPGWRVSLDEIEEAFGF